AAIRTHLVPSHCFGEILRNAEAIGVNRAEIDHGDRRTLRSGLLKPLNAAGRVALYSHAKGVLQTHVRFGQEVVLICCLLAPTEGLRVVLRHKAPESIREA